MTVEEVKMNVRTESAKAGGYYIQIADYICNELLTCRENADLVSKKSLGDAVRHITNEARKTAKNSMAIVEDNEVYGWIREFYGISDLTVVKEEKKPEAGKVVSLLDYL